MTKKTENTETAPVYKKIDLHALIANQTQGVELQRTLGTQEIVLDLTTKAGCVSAIRMLNDMGLAVHDKMVQGYFQTTCAYFGEAVILDQVETLSKIHSNSDRNAKLRELLQPLENEVKGKGFDDKPPAEQKQILEGIRLCFRRRTRDGYVRLINDYKALLPHEEEVPAPPNAAPQQAVPEQVSEKEQTLRDFAFIEECYLAANDKDKKIAADFMAEHERKADDTKQKIAARIFGECFGFSLQWENDA